MVTPTSAILPALGAALEVTFVPLAALATGAAVIVLVVLIVGLLTELREASTTHLFAAGADARPADPAAPPAERPAA